MNQTGLTRRLAHLPLAGIRYFDQTGSTNDDALAWAAQGARDGSLVVADSQTTGRGRLQRRWITRPGTSLAFSLVLRPSLAEKQRLGLFSPLAALAVCQVLREEYHLNAEIKWPNDVLINRRKVCGILVEAGWLGEELQAVVVGVGVNVASSALEPADVLLYPATSIEVALGRLVEREGLLAAILQSLFTWRQHLTQPHFIAEWEKRLAFRGEEVEVEPVGSAKRVGRIIGVDLAGSLLLLDEHGMEVRVMAGDVHLRPVEEEKKP
ncbi:MAG TPA: biotin--[acetyl-CoA-carboxylase] ligase [Anaerolineaceae bacterium]